MKASNPHAVSDPQVAIRLLDCILHIADTMNGTELPSAKKMNKILTIVLDYMGAERGSIMVLERRKLVVCAATRPEIIGHTQPLDADLVASWVARQGEPLFIEDISKDKRFPMRGGATYKKNSLLCVPIFHKDKVAGTINVSDKAGNRDLLKQDGQLLLHFSSIIIWGLVLEDLQAKLTRQRAKLRTRNKELQRQQELRSQLSSMLIHDLKTPLAEVVANLDILSYSITDDTKEFLEGAQIGCDRAIRMVSNLVSVDKISDGELQLLEEDVKPHDLLSEALSSIKAIARLKDIGIVHNEDPEIDLPVLRIDRTLLLRVFQNILANAVSYSSPQTTITAGIRLHESHVIFMLVDEGPGIPAEMSETIFDKYARLSNKHDALVGTGMGLHFCRLAVELHQGRIWVEGREGQGSCFFVELPL
ncbi:MAG: ATP-binding protein [Thermodesulfobacteriota bacterium]